MNVTGWMDISVPAATRLLNVNKNDCYQASVTSTARQIQNRAMGDGTSEFAVSCVNSDKEGGGVICRIRYARM